MATVMPTPESPELGTAGSSPTSVDGLLDDNSYLPLKHRGQEPDDHDQTTTEHQQGTDQQDDANNNIQEFGIHKEVLA